MWKRSNSSGYTRGRKTISFKAFTYCSSPPTWSNETDMSTCSNHAEFMEEPTRAVVREGEGKEEVEEGGEGGGEGGLEHELLESR